jgi:hypothetical protein
MTTDFEMDVQNEDPTVRTSLLRRRHLPEIEIKPLQEKVDHGYPAEFWIEGEVAQVDHPVETAGRARWWSRLLIGPWQGFDRGHLASRVIKLSGDHG